MANRIPPDQTLVVQGVPEERRGMVADAINIQSMTESAVLQSQRSSLLGPITFVHDKIPGIAPRYLCYANYKDSLSCMVGLDGLERWLRERDWGQMVTLYIKMSGPTMPKIMVPADQTLVIKGLPEEQKEVLTRALQTQTSGLVAAPTFVEDKNNIMILYGGPKQFVCYANYIDAHKCVEAVVCMETWLREQGDWGRMLLVYVKILDQTRKLTMPTGL